MPTMRRFAAIPVLAIVASAVLIALTTFSSPHSAQGIIPPFPTPPPFGVALVVNTTSDLVDPGGGKCSLRSAIAATNINGHAGNCDASLSEPGGTDGIFFNIGTGTPVIDVGSTPLPAITDKLGINGKTGGATRVELRGPGALQTNGAHGLTITSPSVTIENMVIDRFDDDGVYASNSASNLKLLGNIIGMNASGTTRAPNLGYGVQIQGSGAHIGGATNGGFCSGDCNLISGNVNDQILLDTGESFALIKGNFIGPDITGTKLVTYLSRGLLTGVDVKGSNNIIGGTNGTTPGGACTGDCNLISSLGGGVYLSPGTTGNVIEGNFIGTDVTGSAALGNTNGVVNDSSSDVTIGGDSANARNVISANSLYSILTSGNATISGNFIGTNSAGTASLGGNGQGVFVTGPGVVIGGTSGVTTGADCTGACNVISGYGTGTGVYLSGGADGAHIQGNFIGTNAAGTQAVGNHIGIHAQAMNVLIGGTSQGAGNLISGNTTGANVSAGNVTIQGNLVGTNSAGSSAIPNGGGLDIGFASGSVIGGTDPGAGNLISGNTNDGILVRHSSYMQIQGNHIGTAADGSSPLPNGGNGILFFDQASSDLVGGQPTAAANIIAFNGGDGIRNDGQAGAVTGNMLWRNSIFSNNGRGIKNIHGGNAELSPPVITFADAANANGTACANCHVDVYSDEDGQGRHFEGTLTVDGSGNWVRHDPFTGPDITAVANDQAGNSSEFSAPFNVVPPTPTASPTPSTAPGQHKQGDLNCDDAIDTRDALRPLRASAGLAMTQPVGCPRLGSGSPQFGDVRCDGTVDGGDTVVILQFVVRVAIKPPQQAGCTPIGEILP